MNVENANPIIAQENGLDIEISLRKQRVTKSIDLANPNDQQIARSTYWPEYEKESGIITIKTQQPSDDVPGIHWTESGPLTTRYRVFDRFGNELKTQTLSIAADPNQRPLLFITKIKVHGNPARIDLDGYDHEDKWTNGSTGTKFHLALPKSK